jgi:hypothetical protein
MTMTLSTVKAQLAAMLKDHPRGTTADMTEHTVIYWDGKSLVGVHLIPDHPGFDGRFELDHHFLGDAHELLTHWFDDPKFSLRVDLVNRLGDGIDKIMER